MGIRSIIKHELVRVEENDPARVDSSGHGKACVAEPSARLLEIEGRAHAIEVTCGCGEVIVLELDYGAQAPQEA